jgi:hypothetical protein
MDRSDQVDGVEKRDLRSRIVTDRQKELAEKHGTPEQFEKAIWKAWEDVFITANEANAAIQKYRAEWACAAWSTARMPREGGPFC